MENICILWDIENVTPSANSLFIDGLEEYAQSVGRVISARAYSDWSKPNFKKLAPQLVTRLSFYLVHVPRERAQKKSADMQLISDALETLTMYGHISTFILITGDSDFRPLVLALRRAGKSIHVICDLQNAAQDLLAVADTFRDFRELLPGGEEEEEEVKDSRPARKSTEGDKAYWYEALAEAAGVMMEEGRGANPGSVKLRMRMLNPNFNEKNMGFRRWSEFVTAAARAGYVRITEKDRQTFVEPGRNYEEKEGPLPLALEALIEILTELDGGKEPRFHEFAGLNQRLMDRSVDVKALGFRQFKAFIQAAETRGLVETRIEKMNPTVRRAAEEKRRRRRRRRAPASGSSHPVEAADRPV